MKVCTVLLIALLETAAPTEPAGVVPSPFASATATPPASALILESSFASSVKFPLPKETTVLLLRIDASTSESWMLLSVTATAIAPDRSLMETESAPAKEREVMSGDDMALICKAFGFVRPFKSTPD